MDDMFVGYKEEFHEIMNEAREKLQKVQTLSGTKRQHFFLDIKKCLREAQKLIPSMIISAKTSGRAENRELVEGYEQALQKLKEELETAEGSAEEDDRARLLGNRRGEEVIELNTRAMVAQKTMQESTSILSDAERMGSDTIRHGGSILEELERQKEMIGHSRGTLGDFNSKLSEARSVMNDVWSKMNTVSVLKIIIITVLIVACCSVVYFRFIWSPDKSGQSAPAPPLLPPFVAPTSGMMPTGDGS